MRLRQSGGVGTVGLMNHMGSFLPLPPANGPPSPGGKAERQDLDRDRPMLSVSSQPSLADKCPLKLRDSLIAAFWLSGTRLKGLAGRNHVLLTNRGHSSFRISSGFESDCAGKGWA
jgi:hypothetical protein